MKKAILIFLLFSVKVSSAQDSTFVRDMPRDAFIFNFSYIFWQNAPEDVELKPVPLEFDFYTMLPLFGIDNTFSGAAGLGISCSNNRLNALPATDEANITYFDADTLTVYDYKVNKLSVVYIDIPLELRLRSTPKENKKCFKLALGFKAGYMISNYHKYKGEDFRAASDDKVKFKEYNRPNLLSYRYGVYVRFGYSDLNLAGYYSLSPVFKEDKGPDIMPFSAGLCVTLNL